MKKSNVASALLASIILMTGCKPDFREDGSDAHSQPTPSVVTSEDLSQPIISEETDVPLVDTEWDEAAVQAAYKEAEIWQQVYYDVVVSELENDPQELELYFSLEGEPLLAVNYTPDGEREKRYKAWRIENGQATILLDAFAMWLEFDRVEGVLNSVTAEEWDDENPEPWSTTLIRDSGWQPYNGPDSVLTLPVYFADKIKAPTLKRRVADFFLDTYLPPTPSDAPDWVGEYMKYLHNHLDSPYMMEKSDTWFDHGTIRGIVLYEGEANGAPILFTRDIPPDGWLGEYYYLGERGRYTAYKIWGLNFATLYQDGQGKRIIELESSYTNWHIMGKTGWDHLFGEGSISPVLPCEVYCNEAHAYFEKGQDAQADQWLIASREQAFAQNAIITPLTPYEGISYELATTPGTASDEVKISPWDEVEVMLIDAFCDFARRTGQMA